MTPRPPGLSPHRSTGAGGQSRYEYQCARGAPKRQLYGQPYMRTDPRKITYIFGIRSNDTRWGQGTAFLWAGKIGCSSARTQEAIARPPSTRSCEPPGSTALSPRPGSPTSSRASAPIRSTGSQNCCPGTGRHRRRKASPPEPTFVKPKSCSQRLSLTSEPRLVARSTDVIAFPNAEGSTR
jgi:hypothetical protein